jgi:hypothetical protein
MPLTPEQELRRDGLECAIRYHDVDDDIVCVLRTAKLFTSFLISGVFPEDFDEEESSIPVND